MTIVTYDDSEVSKGVLHREEGNVLIINMTGPAQDWKITKKQSQFPGNGKLDTYWEFDYRGRWKDMFLGTQNRYILFANEKCLFDVRKVTHSTAHMVQGWGYAKPLSHFSYVERSQHRLPEYVFGPSKGKADMDAFIKLVDDNGSMVEF